MRENKKRILLKKGQSENKKELLEIIIAKMKNSVDGLCKEMECKVKRKP